MNNKENDIIYTAQDIDQYLSGKLSPLQMHAMEKAALDDPFLAEAMEGYEGMKAPEWNGQLTFLKNKFADKEESQAKIIAMPHRKNNWWKVAAAAVLLISTATISYLLINKKDTSEIAQATEQDKKIPAVADSITTTPATTAPVNEGTVAITTTDAQVKNNIPESKNKTTDNGDVVIINKPAQSDDIAFQQQTVPSAAKQQEVEALKVPAKASSDAEALAKVAQPVIPSSEKRERKTDESKANTNIASSGAISQTPFDKKTLGDKEVVADAFLKKEKESPLNKSFIAQVVGPDNTPLPFANISIKNENFGTYADVKGNFRLVSSDSLLTVEVKATGYQPRFYTLQSFVQQNKIVLAEEDATALKYKTVVGTNNTAARSKLSRRASLVKDSLVNVEPADGWDNYNTYVNNNIEIPDDIVKKDIHGKVELSFDVKSNGTITNIKVDKSLCDNCDEAAKRLLEQGPQWKVKKGKKGKGKVIVEF